MIGQTLNHRYTITARLGKGAMGTVYRATDTQSGREVALKVISSELVVDPDMLERFKREGEALSKLKHPNIVEFLDAFQHGEHYVIVMEYVSGGSLHELISKGPLPLDRANRIALELCDALIRSHHLNIVHRDIKPENVLIAEDGTPKLADFGVARLSEGTRMTKSGTQVGTPYYMSPEAWEGKPLDAQADIWSLGVILFEMLTGQVPFGGDTGAAVMNKVLTTQPPDMKKLRAEVPPKLAQIIKQMLTRDKTRRYPTMRQLAADLERGQLSQGTVNASVYTRGKLFRAGIVTVIIAGLAAVIFNSKNSTTLTNPDPTLSPTQKSQNETVVPEPTSPTQITATSTESVIFPPTAFVNEPEKIFYDQFEEQTYDGDFNHSLWIAKSSTCTITQLAGALRFVNNPAGSHQECDLYAGRPTTLQLASQLGVFEVQAMISSDYNHKSLATKELQFRTDSLSGGTWFALCGLIVSGSNKVEGFMNMGLFADEPNGYQDYYGTTSLEDGFDVWHTVRLEMDPKSLAVSCLVDEQLVGAVVPRDAELLASAQFARIIEAARGSQAFATSYVDNVYFETPSLTPSSGVYLMDLSPMEAKAEQNYLGYGVFPWSEGPMIKGSPIFVLGRDFEYAIFAHALSVLKYNLDLQYQQFKTQIYYYGPCEPTVDGAIFRVFGNDKLLYESPELKYEDDPIAVSVPLTDIDQLLLSTDSLSNASCDWTIWLNPILIP